MVCTKFTGSKNLCKKWFAAEAVATGEKRQKCKLPFKSARHGEWRRFISCSLCWPAAIALCCWGCKCTLIGNATKPDINTKEVPVLIKWISTNSHLPPHWLANNAVFSSISPSFNVYLTLVFQWNFDEFAVADCGALGMCQITNISQKEYLLNWCKNRIDCINIYLRMNGIY